MKFTYTREQRKPKASISVKDKKSSGVAYINGDEAAKPFAMCFRGKADKPNAYYTFKTTDRRNAFIAEFFAATQEIEKRRAENRKERTIAPRGVEVGDVLRSMWGYDQTNIDYYQVTALVGDKMVEVREICCEREETGFMQGKSVPAINKFKGEPMRRVCRNGSVKIDNVCSASLMPYKVVASAKIYASSNWTAYA